MHERDVEDVFMSLYFRDERLEFISSCSNIIGYKTNLNWNNVFLKSRCQIMEDIQVLRRYSRRQFKLRRVYMLRMNPLTTL